MQRNYFVIRQLALALHRELAGTSFTEAFSTGKEDIFLCWETFAFRCTLAQGQLFFRFPDEEIPQRNAMPWFRELAGDITEKVYAPALDRVIVIQFASGYRLLFRLYGPQPDVYLLDKADTIQEAFNQRKKAGETLPVSGEGEIPASPIFTDRIPDTALLESRFPYMRGAIAAHLQQQGWFEMSVDQQQQKLHELWDYLLHPGFFVHHTSSGPGLTLFHAPGAKSFSNILQAADYFSSLWLRDFYFYHQRNQLVQHYEALLRKCRKTIALTQQRIKELETEVPLEEIGHILMANLYQVGTGVDTAVLDDFYRGGAITIKLNKNLSPQQNAEAYYRKAKNRHIEQDTLHKRLSEAIQQEEEIRQAITAVQEATQPAELRAFKTAVRNKTQDEAPLPYRELEYMGWTIRIGKSASDNDELITRHAHKDDIWLHARSVAGSHVLVKNKPGQQLPAPVLEKAASLAAWYSKGKSESLCAVVYTQRKYVRKPKGAAPGKVIVEKEQVIMVKPQPIDS